MADGERQPHQFGTNLWLVEEMYREYLADPESVGESWREFFSDYEPASGLFPTPRFDGDRTRGQATAREAERQAGEAAQPTPDGSTEAKAKPTPDEGAEETAEPELDRVAEAPKEPPEGDAGVPDDAERLRGVAATIARNMESSLEVPTATSIRVIPAKLLEVNRRIVNNQLDRTRRGKVSFTHLIGWALVRALQEHPAMKSIYHERGGTPHIRRPEHVNLGLAMDIERPDGSRTLLVPNIKAVDTMDFAGFYRAYEEAVRRVRQNDLDPEMFAGTTCTLTNPGTVGTVGSVPRLMADQSVIVGVGAIDYPSEFQATDPRTLAEIGVGKVITLTSTYDHRVIQGAESGLFLRTMHELLLGQHDFYDDVFQSLHIPYEPVRWRRDENPRIGAVDRDNRADKQIAVQKLINQYRVRGHLIANLNPLFQGFQRVHPELDPATYGLTIWDLDREFATGGLAGQDRMTLGDILGVLRDAYCRTIGVEYMHSQEPDQKSWIQARVEGVRTEPDKDEQLLILRRLNHAEAFEKFLHTKYLGHKRFGIEGAESTIPMLAAMLDEAADAGISEAVMGMAHRGRLNVLANILHKSYERIFREFEGDMDPESIQGSGDVKYHLGTSGVHKSPDGNEISVELASNPSHLEAVDPVVQGMVRARLEELEVSGEDFDREVPVLPLLVHGDAAFAGQGVVAECFTMSGLRGYRVGGTVHLVINNQLGFTTGQEAARSSTYATDIAKMVQAPILHVNGDDPEACVRAMKLAFAFRQEFGKDVVVDLVCYRRHGHNEGDDPSYTQPLMYSQIEERRSVRKLYTEELVIRGDLTIDEAEQMMDEFRQQLEAALRETRESTPPQPTEITPPRTRGLPPPVETGVARERLDHIIGQVTSAPDGFTLHPKLEKQLQRRRQMLDEDQVDWAMGEAFAFGTLVTEGVPVRLAGQDTRRGTFSQRHSVFVDHETAQEFTPLDNLTDDQAPFTSYDSPLSEYAAMGFEYGYTVKRKDALVCWEAQFGDFVNGGQIVVDQFLVAAEEKWAQTSRLVLLLPHGYEGQGPEHSSARLERFLVLAAQDNIQIAQPTDAAQYFHLLRRQMHRDIIKPLVVLTPKGLLRARPATSAAEAFTAGHFREVLSDPGAPAQVDRVLLCSGKIAFELMKRRDEREAPAAIVRVEQLYPYPGEQILEHIRAHEGTKEVFWVQDEPENMGAWPFMHGRLHRLLRDDYTLRHISRYESASPASGSAAIHELEQEHVLSAAFEGL